MSKVLEAPDSGADLRRAALRLARRGWSVFPVRPGSKVPAVRDWEARATADPDRIAARWPAGPFNVGVACGPSGLAVVDLDTHGTLPDDWRQLGGIRDGAGVLAQLCTWARQPWPQTHAVVTPSRGCHLYYRQPDGVPVRNTAGRIGPMVDTRGAGGFVLGAGSVIGGQPYREQDEAPPAELPGWLARLLAETPRPPVAAVVTVTPGVRLAALARVVAGKQPGTRNDGLFWAACRAAEMVRDGHGSEAGVTEPLVRAAVDAGLSEHEARTSVASAFRMVAR